MTSCVYLIEAQIGLVKIGFAGSVRGRLASIRTHTPVPVRLLAMWPGARPEERALHQRFSVYRSHNEWFRIEGALLGFIAEKLGMGLDSVQSWEQVLHGRPERQARKREVTQSYMRAAWSDPKKKLEWLGQTLSGKREQAALGHVPYPSRTKEQHALSWEIHKAAHREVRASTKGRELITAVLASGRDIGPPPGCTVQDFPILISPVPSAAPSPDLARTA